VTHSTKKKGKKIIAVKKGGFDVSSQELFETHKRGCHTTVRTGALVLLSVRKAVRNLPVHRTHLLLGWGKVDENNIEGNGNN